MLIAVIVGLHVYPMLDLNFEQDACSFGPTSNERYRELLAAAKAREKARPFSISRTTEADLQSRVYELVPGIRSPYERLAAMHAVMRSLGANYRKATPERSDPYRDPEEMAGDVSFHYHLDVNRLGYFRPVLRNAWIVASLSQSVPGTDRGSPGEIAFIVNFPNVLHGSQPIERSRFGEVCPPVPRPEAAHRFE